MYLGGFFASSPDEVNLYCSSAPKSFLASVFADSKDGTEADRLGLQDFISKLVRLERRAYITITRCLAAYEHALLSLFHHPELTYSLLVFALECLCQGQDQFEPAWTDYPRPLREKLDVVLTGLDPTIADSVRATLVTDAHVALQKRVQAFVLKYVPDVFFDAGRAIEGPRLRKSVLLHSIASAYDLRSRYAHELKAADNLLTLGGGSPGEVCRVATQGNTERDFLTIRGLHRLVREVLINFVSSQKAVDEDFEYVQDLEQSPGSVRVKAPEYWLNDIQGFTVDKALVYYEGLLHSYNIRDIEGKQNPEFLGVGERGLGILTLLIDNPPNLAAIGGQALTLRSQRCSKSEKNLLTAIAVACGVLTQFPSGQIPRCTPELLSAALVRGWRDLWTADQCQTAMEEHFTHRRVSLPEKLEVAMAIHVANAWELENDMDRFHSWLHRAYCEASSFGAIQKSIAHSLTANRPVDLTSLLPLFKQASVRTTLAGP
jgi:hypothetical protein